MSVDEGKQKRNPFAEYWAASGMTNPITIKTRPLTIVVVSALSLLVLAVYTLGGASHKGAGSHRTWEGRERKMRHEEDDQYEYSDEEEDEDDEEDEEDEDEDEDDEDDENDEDDEDGDDDEDSENEDDEDDDEDDDDDDDNAA